jgi:hypothetical protein
MVSKRNKKLAAKYRGVPCINCGRGGSVGDHVLNYAGIPKRDCELNLWPLCIPCHYYKTHDGLTKFVEDNNLQGILRDRGFYFDEKWRHEKLGK